MAKYRNTVLAVWTQCTWLYLNVPNNFFQNLRGAIDFTKEKHKIIHPIANTGCIEQYTVPKEISQTVGSTKIYKKSILVSPYFHK